MVDLPAADGGVDGEDAAQDEAEVGADAVQAGHGGGRRARPQLLTGLGLSAGSWLAHGPPSQAAEHRIQPCRRGKQASYRQLSLRRNKPLQNGTGNVQRYVR